MECRIENWSHTQNLPILTDIFSIDRHYHSHCSIIGFIILVLAILQYCYNIFINITPPKSINIILLSLLSMLLILYQFFFACLLYVCIYIIYALVISKLFESVSWFSEINHGISPDGAYLGMLNCTKYYINTCPVNVSSVLVTQVAYVEPVSRCIILIQDIIPDLMESHSR